MKLRNDAFKEAFPEPRRAADLAEWEGRLQAELERCERVFCANWRATHIHASPPPVPEKDTTAQKMGDATASRTAICDGQRVDSLEATRENASILENRRVFDWLVRVHLAKCLQETSP